jgi:hypothetical protein
LWTDEANFTLDGSVYTHQCIIWSASNPHATVMKSLYPEKVTVWIGFTANFILKPFFFEATVSKESYLDMLKEHVVPQLKAHHQCSRVVFQQDGAPPHVANVVKEFLSSTFGHRIISRHFADAWPPRSPDLSPNDYWLWGALKSKVYSQRPSSLEELKERILQEVDAISRDQLTKAVENLPIRLNAVLLEDGKHFEHLY